MEAKLLIKKLGGTNAAARFFDVKPPSVCGWIERGCIPKERLLEKAVALEKVDPTSLARTVLWPDCWRDYWPELPAPTPPRADQALQTQGV